MNILIVGATRGIGRERFKPLPVRKGVLRRPVELATLSGRSMSTCPFPDGAVK